MINIVKRMCDQRKGINSYTFSIELPEGSFEIFFAGNLDLYWSYNCKSNEIKNSVEKTFNITKDMGFFYNIIKELYENVRDYNIYTDSDCLHFEEEYMDDLKDRLKYSDSFNSQKLFSNNMVDWHSDDFSYDESSRLLIEPNGDDFKITFVRGLTDMGFFTYSVRICNSGSRYNPFNVCFMHMYHQLIEYNPSFSLEEDEEYQQLSFDDYLDDDCHQLSISEYLDELKLSRKKEN